MLEIFVYPVSAVMKLWHLIMHDWLGMEESTAWVVSIVGLVITVRALISPFNWIMKRSSRASELMRPELAELQEKYGSSTDPADVHALDDGRKALQEKYGYSLAAGCVPALIQLPVFLGLYRMLLWMARPDSRSEAEAPIGVLSLADIDSFLQAEIGGVPVQAYLAMSESRLLELGTTPGEVRSFVLPFLIAAILFTVLNLTLSLTWSWQNLDWSSGTARGSFKFMVGLSLVVPLLLLMLGLTGPIPVALIFYWFCNGLWTLAQTAVINSVVLRKWPQQEEHHALRKTARAQFRAAQQQEKEEEAWVKERRRAARRAAPEEAATIRAEVEEFLQRQKEEAAEQKKVRRERNRAQAAARNARRREQNAAKKLAREQEKSGSTEHKPESAPSPETAPEDQIE
ncbi:MAG TPA: membrane protein insertase YidC [Corynebacterium sp.]|nr:membrane protein insertase YidC [Corynebacterium sp.]